MTKYWPILVAFLLLAGWFYWFQIRPEIELKKCYENVRLVYNNSWNSHCHYLGREDGCPLSSKKANDLKDSYQKERDRCVKVWVK